MRNSNVFASLCATATLLVCLPASAVPRSRTRSASANTSRQQIEALETRYNNAFNTRDVDGIMSCYAPGKELFVFDAVPPREYPNWDDYKRDWETIFSQFPGPASNQISEQSITVVGPVAYGHNIQSTTFTNKDGSQVHAVVRVTDVYRKIGKKWLIVQEHVSFPVNIATGQADLLSKP